MSTFHARFLAACASIGVSNHRELMAKWKTVYKQELDRQTAHRWFQESAKEMAYEYLFRFADMTRYSARWIALHAGDPQQWMPVSTDQQEILVLHKELKGERKENWVKTGRDALTAQVIQEAEKPSIAVPYPVPK